MKRKKNGGELVHHQRRNISGKNERHQGRYSADGSVVRVRAWGHCCGRMRGTRGRAHQGNIGRAHQGKPKNQNIFAQGAHAADTRTRSARGTHLHRPGVK
eukprot:670478-Prymnesium_polylepis.1